tara:strand:- start:7086 stop:7361 length:276 start_codon:yes stop_codon:yes gene_type:complete
MKSPIAEAKAKISDAYTTMLLDFDITHNDYICGRTKQAIEVRMRLAVIANELLKPHFDASVTARFINMKRSTYQECIKRWRRDHGPESNIT